MGGSQTANHLIRAPCPIPFGANNRSAHRPPPDGGRQCDVRLGALRLRAHPARRVHTAWSHCSLSPCFDADERLHRSVRRVPTQGNRRSRQMDGEPGGLALQLPVARTALLRGTAEEREQDRRPVLLDVAASPLAHAVGLSPRWSRVRCAGRKGVGDARATRCRHQPARQ
jgi:hypothetical protein